jgi:hypothetical protein
MQEVNKKALMARTGLWLLEGGNIRLEPGPSKVTSLFYGSYEGRASAVWPILCMLGGVFPRIPFFRAPG